MNARYSRQALLPWIGEDGQKRIEASGVAIVGLGALGSICAEFLARAGTARMAIVDRDLVEESNLQRQLLYTEEDRRARLPKAVAAERRLLKVRPDLKIEVLNEDLSAESVLHLVESYDVVLDGTDNFETRYLINDAAVSRKKPWVYAGAVSSYGSVMVIRPGDSPCLRCVFPTPPEAGSTPTCATAGILGPAAGAIASIEAGEAIKLLAGREDLCLPGLFTLDLGAMTLARVRIPRDPNCSCCTDHDFEFLDERKGTRMQRLCGSDAILLLAPRGTTLDLPFVAKRLEAYAAVYVNSHLIQTQWDGHPVTLYKDGRALIRGISAPAHAHALYARYLGT